MPHKLCAVTSNSTCGRTIVQKVFKHVNESIRCGFNNGEFAPRKLSDTRPNDVWHVGYDHSSSSHCLAGCDPIRPPTHLVHNDIGPSDKIADLSVRYPRD